MQKPTKDRPANVIGGPFDGMHSAPGDDEDIGAASRAKNGRWHWYRWKPERKRWEYACANVMQLNRDE